MVFDIVLLLQRCDAIHPRQNLSRAVPRVQGGGQGPLHVRQLPAPERLLGRPTRASRGLLRPVNRSSE